MSLFATRYAELKRAVADGCDRLVHPRVTAETERGAQRRILGVLLAYPFFASIAAWLLLPAAIGVDLTLAFICVAFMGCGLAALAVTARRTARPVLAIALGIAATQIAVLIAAAGGLQSPLTLIAAVLPVEAWLALRTRRALGWGFGAMVAALAAQGALIGPFAGDAAAWHWLLPVAYACLLAPRMGGMFSTTGISTGENAPATDDAERIGLRLAPNGDLIDIDPAARDLLGIDPDLLIGTGFFQRVHVADRVVLLCALADLRDGAARRKVELRLRLPAAQEGAAPVHRALALDLTRATPGTGIGGTLRDNSEMADLRAALAAAREENGALEASKSRLLAAVSHELRTPLNSIIGFSDMLLCEVQGSFRDPRQRETLEIVREAGNHLLAVVNSILDVSKMEAGSYATNPEPFRFDEAASLCAAMVRLQAETKRIRLTTDIASGNGEVKADRRAVQQMLLNLLSNAIKFTPDGGEVSVGAKRIGSRLHFWVSDTGIGIAADDLDRIGQPFAQVHNDYTRQVEGAGLGLALVKGLVALHQGTMAIDSTFGKGTTVTISLPVEGPAGVNGGGGPTRLRGARGGEDANGTLRKAS